MQHRTELDMAQRAAAKVTIVNSLGLHARPATEFVQTALKFKCEVAVVKGGESVSGKSIMEMMMLAATQGTQLEIVAEGQDAAQCVQALSELVARGFNEE
ncbi:MAG: HPr family phosphocarrier protein [Phycisphaeraceae bacterium]|nr:HPr family phosphocarrier protein [Phycisphaeraceae bacterium]MCW5764155.1 HPr family phosphocarrier protein [Phycisphaeraceae bacterium]